MNVLNESAAGNAIFSEARFIIEEKRATEPRRYVDVSFSVADFRAAYYRNAFHSFPREIIRQLREAHGLSKRYCEKKRSRPFCEKCTSRLTRRIIPTSVS